MTEAERADAANLAPGDMLQFHQNVPGHTNGSRLVVREGEALPLRYAARFQVYRPAERRVAVGDRLRVTANGQTKDGTHRLNNGMLLTVQGFTPAGDIIVDKGWVIGRDFGHIAYGYAVTSHASQGKTVDRVFIAQSSLSFPASSREQFYVSVSRAKEKAVIFTSDKAALRRAVLHGEDRLSATELLGAQRRGVGPTLKKHLARLRRLATLGCPRGTPPLAPVRAEPSRTEVTYER
ncbi:MAG TPA: ATP-binding domain-containing protein [Gemmataceae bacterium]|nr:ATP-binding domain-containing protein [Gemmataceae bacterium]